MRKSFVAFRAAKVWLGLRAVVEAKDALDNLGEVFRHRNYTGAATVHPCGRLIVCEVNTEGFAHRGDRSREDDTAASAARLDGREPVLVGKLLNFSYFIGVCAVGGLKFFAAEVAALFRLHGSRF